MRDVGEIKVYKKSHAYKTIEEWTNYIVFHFMLQNLCACVIISVFVLPVLLFPFRRGFRIYPLSSECKIDYLDFTDRLSIVPFNSMKKSAQIQMSTAQLGHQHNLGINALIRPIA